MNCGSDSFLKNEIDQSFEIDSDNGNPISGVKAKAVSGV